MASNDSKIPPNCDKILFAEDLVSYVMLHTHHAYYQPSIAAPFREFIYEGFNDTVKAAIYEICDRILSYRGIVKHRHSNPDLNKYKMFAKRLQKKYFDEGLDPKLFLFYCVHVALGASRLVGSIGLQAAGDLAVNYISESISSFDMFTGGWNIVNIVAAKYANMVDFVDGATPDSDNNFSGDDEYLSEDEERLPNSNDGLDDDDGDVDTDLQSSDESELVEKKSKDSKSKIDLSELKDSLHVKQNCQDVPSKCENRQNISSKQDAISFHKEAHCLKRQSDLPRIDENIDIRICVKQGEIVSIDIDDAFTKVESNSMFESMYATNTITNQEEIVRIGKNSAFSKVPSNSTGMFESIHTTSTTAKQEEIVSIDEDGAFSKVQSNSTGMSVNIHTTNTTAKQEEIDSTVEDCAFSKVELTGMCESREATKANSKQEPTRTDENCTVLKRQSNEFKELGSLTSDSSPNSNISLISNAAPVNYMLAPEPETNAKLLQQNRSPKRDYKGQEISELPEASDIPSTSSDDKRYNDLLPMLLIPTHKDSVTENSPPYVEIDPSTLKKQKLSFTPSENVCDSEQ